MTGYGEELLSIKYGEYFHCCMPGDLSIVRRVTGRAKARIDSTEPVSSKQTRNVPTTLSKLHGALNVGCFVQGVLISAIAIELPKDAARANNLIAAAVLSGTNHPSFRARSEIT